MRNRKTLTLALLGFIFGLSGAAYLNTKGYVFRNPSSIQNPKKFRWSPTPLGKQLSVIRVAIEQPSNIPETQGEVLLVGHILANQTLTHPINYRWVLPEGVYPVNGETTGIITDVPVGQDIEVTLKVEGFTKNEQKIVFLRAETLNGGFNVGQSGSIVSRFEDTWEAVAPQMRQAAEEQLPRQKLQR